MEDRVYLELARNYAKENTGCTKVAVGSVIAKGNRIISMGANRAIPNLCRVRGCLRVEKYGTNSKDHRNPEDCRALHSEIDAIAQTKEDLSGSTIYVTRYPCEGCARAIVAAGIKKVVYGRQQVISDMTREIFEYYDIQVIHASDYMEDDTVL